MPVDDIRFQRIQTEIPLGVLHGLAGVIEPVELVIPIVFPPVVEKIVMKQCAPHQTPPIHVPAPFLSQTDAAKRHRHGMIVAGGAAVLGDRALLIHGRRTQNITAVFP